jgi:probable rRNA maturation factor
MIKINVLVSNKSWKKYIKNPDAYLKKKVKRLNEKNIFFKKKVLEFNLLLSNESEVKELNRKFRKKNKTTDVLSFPYHEKKKLNKLFKDEKSIYLGDIAINLKKILNDSKIKSVKMELDKLWLHGLLHLLGYRHKTNKDYAIMKRLEIKFFKIIN